MQFWSDKASLTEHGRVSYHPLNMVFLPCKWTDTREQWPLAQVAFLPILSRSDYPSFNDDDWRILQAELLHESMRRVLFPALDIGGGIGFDYIQVCNMCMYKDIRVTYGAQAEEEVGLVSRSRPQKNDPYSLS